MSIKIKKYLKAGIIILSIPIICNLFSFLTDFTLQIGRIIGTLIRIIIEL